MYTAAAVASQQLSLPLPFRYLFIVIALTTVARLWLLRPGPFRAALQRGGWLLAIAVLSSLGILAFGVAIAMGQMVIAIATAAVCAPPTWFLFIRFIRDRSQPAE